MTMPKVLPELVARWIDGDLTDAEIATLRDWLAGDPLRLRDYLRAVHAAEDLRRLVRARAEVGAITAGGASSQRRPGISAARRRRWPVAVLAVAAVLGLAALGRWLMPSAPAVIAAAQDATMVRADGTSVDAVGMRLHGGERLRTAAAGRVELRWGDGSSATLSAAGELLVDGDQRAKRLRLITGALTVDAQPQPADRPLTVATPHAEVVVVGTAFALHVDAQGTALAVEHGSVRVRDQAGERTVAAGERLGLRAAARSAVDARIGLELPAVGPDSDELVFADAFRQARPWAPRQAGPGEAPALDLDALGWPRALLPGQWAETVLCERFAGHYPGGTWTCRWQGSGTLEFAGDATLLTQAAGAAEIAVRPSARGIVIRLRRSDSADPLRRLSLFPPGCAGATFHPAFLARCRGVAAVRTWAWSDRRLEQPLGWTDRLTAEHAPMPAERGVAPELALALAAALDADCWLCLPPQADDSYVDGLAALARARLPAGRRCYVEYGHDLWDAHLAAGAWAQRQGVARGHPPAVANLRFTAERSREVFTRWRAAFSATSADDVRTVRVLAGMIGNAFFADEVLSWRDAGLHADALAIHAALGGGVGDPGADRADVAAIETLSADAFLDQCRRTLAANQSALAEDRALAQRWGLRLIAYHGGARIWSHQRGLTGAAHRRMAEVLHDPRIGELDAAWWSWWRSEAGDLLCALAPLDWRAAGRLPPAPTAALLDPSAVPVWRALRQVVEGAPTGK